MNTGQPATAIDAAQQPWLRDKSLRAIFTIFAAAGAEARAVGGAVRDMFLGRLVGEVDLAVNRPPEIAEALLLQAGIKVVRTGFAHGTVTAVVKGRGYEITSLRRDVETDGRHAEVAYTDEWAEDAARRDFTMNALYADSEGRVYDYHCGLEDLRAGRVRFIGRAEERIAEDYLRILRFFRFHAWYGRAKADEAALAACAEAAGGMVQLSRERITQEWRKLLLAPDPASALALMKKHGVLAEVLPLDLDLERLGRLLSLAPDAGFALRFAALLREDRQLEPVLHAALRLPNREMRDILDLLDPARAAAPDRKAFNKALYRYGAPYGKARLLLQAAADGLPPLLPELLAAAAAWNAPRFPLTGEDFLKLGLASSPRLGVMMREIEDWWIAGGFKAERDACLAEARRLIGEP
ncbi:MAG: CCA tRNA nucleotidyltransferase [Alphaproteobacteria bacterium]